MCSFHFPEAAVKHQKVLVSVLFLGFAPLLPAAVEVSYEASTERIYLKGEGEETLRSLSEKVPEAALELALETEKVWFLGVSIFLEDGATLGIRSEAAGGEVNELRLRSDRQRTVSIQADHGTLLVEGTRITSWNPETESPDDELIDGRAFLLARSRLKDGNAANSALEIRSAELISLGSQAVEEQGCVWDQTEFDQGVQLSGGLSDCLVVDCVVDARAWESQDLLFSGNRVSESAVIHFEATPAQTAVNNVEALPFSGNRYFPQPASMRWAISSNRIYVSSGQVTLSEIRAQLPSAPLEELSPGVWFLQANVQLEGGAELHLIGRDRGGDVDELRLLSSNVDLPDAFVSITADWGKIEVDGVRILSWDKAANGPDEEFENFGRAFIRVRSGMDSDDVVRQSRMDIVDSEIAHLGYQGAEAYGLTWKVKGFDGIDESIFEKVEVFGNIKRSTIHHLHYAVYTYGAWGCVWEENELHSNNLYGFDPHDDSDNLWIINNTVYGNGTHGIIASKRCDQVRIIRNRSFQNGKAGIMLHRSSGDSLIENNDTFDNIDSGIAIFASDRVDIRDNRVSGNQGSGIRLSVGSADCR
ncbi:MAG: right-handed parallel beta-helix repeat-containing protein, partial [Verrucomicrobiota bacterium]